MADTVKSIFRQRKAEMLYTFELTSRGQCSEIWSVRMNSNEKKILSDNVIGECDLEIPMLNVGDEFFLDDINRIVTIKKRIRSSNGAITYYVEDELIETENTQKSKEECKRYLDERVGCKNRYDRLNLEYSEYKKIYKYKHRFFNLKKANHEG